MKTSARRQALKDIALYLKQNDFPVNCFNREIWHVAPNRLNTKEISRLNRELGLHKINKTDNAKNFKR